MPFKEQLKNEILPKTVDYYNSGMDINSSIAKAAQDFKLNLDQTDRLLETMNTARVLAHYAKNASDRTSDCDIADRDAVRAMLYGGRSEKKASGAPAARPGAWVFGEDPDSDYMSAPRFRGGAHGLSKAASSADWAASPASSVPGAGASGFTREQALSRVADYLKTASDRRRFAEERKAMALDAIASEVTKIASALSSGYEPEARYALFRAAVRGRCPEALRSIEAAMPASVVKEASGHLRRLSRSNVLDDSRVSGEVDAALSLEEAIRKAACFDPVIDELHRDEDEIKGAVLLYSGLSKAARFNGPGPGPKKKKKDEDGGGKAQADNAWFGNAVGGALKSSVKSMDSVVTNPASKAISDYLRGASISTEALDAAIGGEKQKKTDLRSYLDNLTRSDILSELYSEDPILSEATPEEVTRAYKTLVDMAPEASLNKEVARAILRQSVNAVAVSPFDAKQWADLDTVLLKNRGALPKGERSARPRT